MTRAPGARRLALCFWDGYLGVAPGLIAGIGSLTARGYAVDVILREPMKAFPPAPAFDPARVRITALVPLLRRRASDPPWAYADPWTRLRTLPRRVALRLGEYIDRVRFAWLCWRGARRERYDALVGVDATGMIAAGIAAGRRHTPLVHWSLELETGTECRDPVGRLVVRLARRYQRRAAITIVQDALRARALLTALGSAGGGIVRLVPNAPAGPPRRAAGGWFHERFGLPPNQRIILHAGQILPQMLGEEVARAAARWPADWTLVLHERAWRPSTDPYLQRVAALGGDRVRLSLKPVPYGELDRLFASADVCLALYSTAYGDNFRLMEGASGKLAHALRVGVPVICTDVPGLGDLVRRAGCGLAVDSVDDLAAAVHRILADYERYRERAWSCYRETFEFGRAFEPVLDDLARITGERMET